MSDPIRVVLVEDHALTRIGLKTAIDAAPGMLVIAEADDGIAGLALIERERPNVAVIDIGLPGIDGIDVTRRIRAAELPTHVVILTMHDLETEILAALAAGADAYCVKTSKPDGVIDAIRIASEGGAYFDARIAHVVLGRLGAPGAASTAAADSPLTPREGEILRLVADGIGNTEIAVRLHLGLGTVKGHIRDILEKLSAADRTQAAVTALRRGLI